MRRRFIFLVVLAIITATIGLWMGSPKKTRPSCPCRKAVTSIEKPFVIIIPSYNNAQYVEKNLFSVFSQRYSNYRVIYIDDHSSDGTFEKAKTYAEKEGKQQKIEFVHNPINLGGLANYYRAVQSCKEGEIAVLLDGDDAFAHEEVLAKLNQIYADPDVWMTYGNYLDYPSFTQEPQICKPIPEHVVKKNSYRSFDWCASHLRTFYASLFNQIRLEDLYYNGRCFPMAWDLAFMLPLLEMAGPHALYVPDVLYLYNRTNPLSDHKINYAFQQECATAIRARKPYIRLAALPSSPQPLSNSADLLVFSYNRPLQLYAFLESVEKNLTGLSKLIVLYRSDADFDSAYQIVAERFPAAKWIRQTHPPDDFRTLFLEAVFQTNSSPYILFAVDDLVMKKPVDLQACITALEKTQAYGFYLTHHLQLDNCFMLGRHQGIPPTLPLQDSSYAWQFASGVDDWAYPNSVDLVLYRKDQIRKDLEKISFNNPFSLESAWALRAKKERIGLCFAHSTCMNLPLNLVIPSTNACTHRYTVEELLHKFQDGLKIDLSSLEKVENRSRHVDTEITFVRRDTLNLSD